jgi:hypothetical protein
MEEYLPREKRAATSAVRGLLPKLGPAFISADDAARYVHARIGNKRDKEYGSVILKRLADDKVFATEPIPGKAATFDFSLLLERGARNEFLDPTGYKLVGGVHSHPEQFADLKVQNPRFRDLQVRIFNSFFSERDVVFNHYEGRAFGAAYLSGPNGVLLKYLPSFSDAERRFVDWIDNVSTAVPEDGHDGSLESFIKKVASVGRLSLLVANTDWGGVSGVIDQLWRPYLPLKADRGPIACGGVFPDVARALSYAQARMRRTPNMPQMAMVLKHEIRDEFVATQAFPLGGAAQLPADNQLPLLAGGPLLPEGFHLHGFFYLSRPVPALFPTVEPWLYQQFFSPEELAAYIATSRRYLHASPSVLGISLYLRTRDNALLRYRFSGSPAETRLLATQETSLQQALTPRQFVAQVAEAGELSVEQTSPLWDVEGVVESSWAPYGTFPFKKPTLGQSFSSADKAAQFAHAQVGARRDREYGALILKHPDQHYVLTELLETGANPYGFQGFFPWDTYSKQLALPDGYQLQAWFGSHTAASGDRDAAFKMRWTRDDTSVHVQSFSDVEAYRVYQLQVPGYLSGAADSLVVLEPEASDQSEFTRLFAPATQGSLIARHLADGTYKPADVVRKLAEVSRLRVVLGNGLWGAAGVIDLHWKPFAAASPKKSQPGGIDRVVALPSLSPAFISPDDAALWAHRRIGARREREYGGVILQNPGGYFFATEPVHGKELEFDVREVLSSHADGSFLSIPGYQRTALYHSHPASHDRVANSNTHFSPQQVKAHLNFFSIWDAAADIVWQKNFALSYLSGPDDSLIRYRPSGTFAEQQYARWLLGEIADGPFGGDGTLEDFLKKMQALGELSFITASPLWGGSRGVVPADWQPYQAFAHPPTGLLPLLSAVCSTPTEAIQAAVEGLPASQDTWRIGLILKRNGQSEYVATPALSTQQPRFAMIDFLMWNQDGRYVLPDGLAIEGFYCDAPRARSRVPEAQPWLYRSFFPALGLATAAQEARLIPSAQVAEQGMGLYQRTPDGAVLAYRFSYSQQEADLYRVQDTTVDDHGFETALLTGVLTPQAYVHKVATAGTLQVLSTSRIWNQAGGVADNWRPFSNIPEPVVGPAFALPDDAAYWAHTRIGERRDKEYGGAILKRDNHYFATEPVAGEGVRFDFQRIVATDDQEHFIAPASYECHGLYHSHPADTSEVKQHNPSFSVDQVALFISFFSNADQVFTLTHRDFTPVHYLSGPDGSLLKYTSSGSSEEQSLLRQMMGAEPTVPFTAFEGAVWNLAQAGDLRVVVANRVWGGIRGRVTRGWTLGSPVSRETTVQDQPFFTPQTSMGHTAVLVALNSRDLSGHAAFGFVLKHRTASSYIATLPAIPGTTLGSLFPVRENGQPKLVSNYRLVGLYYASSAQAPQNLPPGDAWLYKRFASPALLVDVMTQSMATTAIQIAALGLKLYLRTVDNALLHWQVPSAESTQELFTIAGQTVTDKGNEAALLDGSLSPRDFVRRVIRAGDLAVVQQGGLWNILGPVHDSEHLALGSGSLSLSATFLSADDAARHAHERIGFRRRATYGGYILNAADGRFVFSEPVVIHGDGFASDLLQPAVGSALLVPPVGYKLYARYASHAALSSGDLERQQRLGWTLADLEVNVTMFSDVEMASVIRARLPAYLSGSPNNLISYTPSGSANELLVLSNTTREPGNHGYFERLEARVLKPVDIVTRLADAGNLQVLVQSSLWGPRATVYSDWTPNFEYADIALQTQALGAVFDSQDRAALDAHLRGYGRNMPAQGVAAYVLKHPLRNEYVVSELLPITTGGSRLSDSSKGVGYLAGGAFAKGFVLAGVFYSQQWQPSGLLTAEAWLTQFFVTPDLLLRAEEDARHLPRPSGTSILPVYLSTLDGALLGYQPQASSRLKQINEGEGVTIDGMNLRKGTLDISRFVSAIAQAGDLRVLYSSQCWDRRGAVSAGTKQWLPYANFVRRRLGPAFYDQDDAARHVRSLLQGNGLMGGVILKRPDGLFVATEPLKVPREDFDPKWIFPDEIVGTGGFPAAHTIVARYRSSPVVESPFVLDATQKNLYRNMLSTRVIASALSVQDARLTREYLLGSDGCVVSYTRNPAALEEQLKQDLQPLNLVRADFLDNRIEHKIRSGQVTPSDFVGRLCQAGILRVVEGSQVWGLPRRVFAEFIPSLDPPNPLSIRNALSDPAFSPVFTQQEDAVRYAHEHRRHGDSVQFGYVLKSQKNGHYMVSLPLVRQSYRDLAQVFPRGLLPQGYGLEGFYLCASNQALAPEHDPLHLAFFSPTDIDTGIRFSIHALKDKHLAFYLSCQDGALLRYQYQGTEVQLDSWGRLIEIRQQLSKGEMTMLDYVRGLVEKGHLDTLIRGRVWTTANRIDSFWQPGVNGVFVPPWPVACGPIFSHGDDAARYLKRRLAPYQSHQYLSAILVNTAGSSYLATVPVAAGIDHSLALRLFYTGPHGYVQPAVPPAPMPDFPHAYGVAGVHLLYNSMPTTDSRDPKDNALVDHFVAPSFLSYFSPVLRGLPRPSTGLYLSCRAGALLKYLPSFSPEESQVMLAGPNVYPTVFLKGLVKTGKLFILDRDEFWMNEGVLSELQLERSNGLHIEVPEADEPLSIRDRDEL